MVTKNTQKPHVPYTMEMMGDALRRGFHARVEERLRKFGAEFEITFAEKDGTPISVARRAQLMGLMAERDPRWLLESGHSLSRAVDGYSLSMKPELGISIVEFMGAPHVMFEPFIGELSESLCLLVDSAKELAMRSNGSGISSYAVPGEGQMMEGRRYRAYHPFLGDGIFFHTVTAAVHVNIEVSADEAPMMMEMLKRYVPAILALSSNSPIYMGGDSGRSSMREWVWEPMYKGYDGIVGIPPKVESMDDMLQMVLDMPAFVTSHGDYYLAYNEPTTLATAIRNGGVEAYDVEHPEVRMKVPPNRDALCAMLRGSRHAVRPRISENEDVISGRLEVRISDTPRSLSGVVAIVAMVRGLVANADKAMERLEMYGDAETAAARLSAINSDLHGTMGKEQLLDIGQDAYALACDGLDLIGEDRKHLDYFKSILESGMTMARVQRRDHGSMSKEGYLDSIEFQPRD